MSLDALATVIREARGGDVEAIARVHVQAWQESYRVLLPAEMLAGLTVAERAQMWRGAFQNPARNARLLVAERDGAIVGFVRGGPTRDADLATEAEIYAVYLVDTVKRQGLGHRLVAEIFAFLRERGFASVGLWVIRENHVARRFYERFGGAPGAEKPFELRGVPMVEVAYRFGLSETQGHPARTDARAHRSS